MSEHLPAQIAHHRRRLPCLILLMCGLATGCTGVGKPPPPAPRAVADAERRARQAAQLQSAENWAAAADAWGRAAVQFQLLNRKSELAIAWHNEGVCWAAQGEASRAKELLERAAALNQELGNREAWWRNQLVLTQLDAADQELASALRLDRLETENDPPRDPRIRALFEHERARAHLRAGHWEEGLARARRARHQLATVGDPGGVAATWVTEARILEAMSGRAEAEAAWRSALTGYEALGVPRGIAVAMSGLGRSVASGTGNSAQAEGAELLERAIFNFKALKMNDEAQQAEEDLQVLRTRNPGESRSRSRLE